MLLWFKVNVLMFVLLPSFQKGIANNALHIEIGTWNRLSRQKGVCILYVDRLA